MNKVGIVIIAAMLCSYFSTFFHVQVHIFALCDNIKHNTDNKIA